MVDTNAIYVLWLRDIKRFIRARSRIIGMLVLPIFFLLGLGLGLGNLIPSSVLGGSYLEFIVPGIIGMSLIFTSVASGTSVLWDRQFGFLKEILVTPNSRSAVVIGRVAGGATTAMLQSFIIVIISLLIGFNIHFTAATALAIVFMFLIATTFISLGLVFGSLINDFQGFQLVTSFVTMPLFFLSNGIFPLSALPGFVKYIAYLNPLSYGVDGLRITLAGATSFLNPIHFGWLVISPLAIDLFMMLLSSAIMIAIASYAFNRTDVG